MIRQLKILWAKPWIEWKWVNKPGEVSLEFEINPLMPMLLGLALFALIVAF